MTNKDVVSIGSLQIPSSVIVIFVSLIIALQHGFTFSIGNHNTYLLQGFHYLHPDLFSVDWFTNETTHYHPFFSWIVYGLYSLTPNGWSFGIANFLFLAVSLFYIYKIIELIFTKHQPLLIFLITASFIAATETYSIGGSYIFSRTFQPSTIASLTFLIGIYYFLQKRNFLSGIYLAIGGLFHVNFLVLGIPLFAMYHIYSRDEFFIKNLAFQLTPSFLVLLIHIPNIIAASMSPDAGYARYIFQEVHAPQHYIPLTYIREFLPFYSWHAFAFILGWRILDSSDVMSKLKIFFILQFIFISIANILTTVVFIPSVSQLYVWRLAPFSVLLAQIIGAYGIHVRLRNAYKNNFDFRQILMFFVYGFLIYLIWNNHYGWFKLVTLRSLLFVGLVLVISGFMKRCYDMSSVKRVKFQMIVIAILFVYTAFTPLLKLPERSNLITGLPENEVSLYQWIENNTTIDALFITPPRFQNFRLNAKRSIIVDWKSPPVIASELIEWYRRIEDVTNFKEIKKASDVVKFYDNHTSESLLDVYDKYNCDYAIVHTEASPEQLTDFKVLFSNEKFSVLQKN